LNNYNTSQPLTDIQRIVQQLETQTQQASMQYQQLLNQEQQNAKILEELAQKERQAAQTIQTALQGHQTAINQLNQVKSLCSQVSISSTTNIANQSLTASAVQPNTNFTSH